MNKNPCKLEILAPCGDMTSVIAAVQSGANAVYLGQKDFSARQNAKNFDKCELLEAVAYCHSRGVKVYQTLNTLIFDSQINSAIECIKSGCECGIDAFIVQDLAVYAIIKKACPSAKLHASTQMAVHTLKGAELLRDMGFKRVVLARELSLSQITEISQSVEIETEVFVQGALCMSVSGQCYISAMIGGRSGNRGNCAGTCRLPFTSSEHDANDLSLKDICLAPHIEELKNAGVCSVKIEGRMKRPEYVAEASNVYSRAISGEEYETETLQAVFSRSGFTDGYLQNKLGKDMFGIRQRDDVVSATNSLLKSIENSYKKEHGIIPIKMEVSIKRNQAISLKALDNLGNSVEAISTELPQEAINKPLSDESVKASLSKLGGTYFFADEISCELDEGLSVKASIINELRREVCEKLAEQRAKVAPISCGEFEFEKPLLKEKTSTKLLLRARFEKFSQIPFERMNELEYIILPVDEVEDNTDRLSFFKEKVIIEPYRAMYQNEQEIILKLTQLKEQGFTRVYASNLAHIKIANELSMQIFGSAYLNCTNSISASELAKLNVTDLTLSFELNLVDARKISTPSSIPLGLFIYGYLPLMLLKNCPIKNQFTCNTCGGNKMLTDRMGIRFKIICNRQKYSELLNSNPLYMADRLNELSPLSFGVLYFTTENMSLCDRIITEYQTAAPAYSSFTRGLYYRGV